jgi:uncharacterized protein
VKLSAMSTPLVETDTTAEREALVTDVDGLTHLLGSACDACGTHTFPTQVSCPCCGGTSLSDTPLPRSGTVWTFTVQRFKPKPPFKSSGEFAPYALGYVDLGPIKVESVLSGREVADWTIGDRVELVVDRSSAKIAFTFAPAKVEL